jgi:hypothetical protein
MERYKLYGEVVLWIMDYGPNHVVYMYITQGRLALSILTKRQ